MKEKLYHIPINDAVNAGDECPFCNIERSIEQDMMDFVLGSGATYMESDVREKTDIAGFCRAHYKKMFDYGNTLGNAWIMKTHLKRTIDQADAAFKHYKPSANGIGAILSKSDAKAANSVTEWVRGRDKTCYICDGFREHYDRYMKSFFDMYFTDKEFAGKINNSKGFCLPHFSDILEYAGRHLNEKKQQEFADIMIPLMRKELEEIYGDVSWLIEKFDYVNKDADWKNSKDALQRSMQRMKGGYPADQVYRAKK